jgi:L-amino acid N-acyltransferase YncA
VAIRLVRHDDSEAIRRIYAPVVETTAISFELEAPSSDEMRRRIDETAPGFPWIVVETGGEVVGYAYAHAFSTRGAYRWSVETSIYIDAAAQRRRHGRALYTALLRVLRLLGYREVLAGIALPNAASVALHESLGFAQVASYRHVGWKLGRWHDVGWWQRSIAEPGTAEPALPLAMGDLAVADLEQALRQVSAS